MSHISDCDYVEFEFAGVSSEGQYQTDEYKFVISKDIVPLPTGSQTIYYDASLIIGTRWNSYQTIMFGAKDKEEILTKLKELQDNLSKTILALEEL